MIEDFELQSETLGHKIQECRKGVCVGKNDDMFKDLKV